MAAIADRLPAPALIVRAADGRVLHANAALWRALGGRDAGDPATLRIASADQLSAAIVWQGGDGELALALRCGDTQVHHLRGHASAIETTDGAAWLFVGVAELHPVENPTLARCSNGSDGLAPLMDAVPALIAYVDRQFVVRFLNATYDAWYASDRRDAIGRRLGDVFPAEIVERVQPFIARALAGETVSFEAEFQYPDGKNRSTRLNYSPDCSPDGRVHGITALIEDISELKQAQTRLSRVTTMLTRAQRVAHIGSWESDLVNDVHWWSDELYRIFGYDPDTVKPAAARYYERIHPDDCEAVTAARRKAFAGGSTYQLTFRIQQPNGEIRHVHARAIIERDSDGKPQTFRGTMHDVTEAHQLRERMQRSRDRARLIADVLPASIFMYNADLRCTYLNECASRNFALSADKTIGMAAEQIMGAELFDKVKGIFEQSRRQHTEALQEIEVVHADGTTHQHEIRCVPAPGAAGETGDDKGGFLLIGIDVTERQRLERRAQQAERMQSVGQLTAGIGHEFNNLLGVMFGNLDLLEDVADSHDQSRKLIDAIRRAAARGAELTDGLLAFSRRRALKPQITDLDYALAEAMVNLRDVLTHNVRLGLEPESDLWPIYADPTQLKKALTDLALNARDAMPAGGMLTIRVANVTIEPNDCVDGRMLPGDFVRLSVIDTGTGMSDKVRERAIEPFFTTKPVGAGAGMGLSMVHGFAHQSGGFVQISSRPGAGTTVDIYLPRATDEADGALDALTPGYRGHAVVLLHQHAVKVWAIGALQRHGFSVSETIGLREFNATLKAVERVDLLVGDLWLPSHESGAGLRLSARASHPDAPLLLIGEQDDAQLEDLVDPHIAVRLQPCSFAELDAAVDKLLAGAASTGRDSAA